ncbi:MAG TPA: DUF885 domain-containing protein [Caulobacterales bacterium]|jgi:hypothetical protein|nr:DUF885 domain-containing protein [Caulobacterales bacterium]
MDLKSIARLAFCSTALMTVIGGADAASPSATTGYNAIVQDYYNAQWKAHPASATSTGVHTYDADLDDVSAAAVTAEIARLKDTMSKLRAIDGAKLSAMDRDDRDVLLGTIDGQLLQEETLQTWRRDPGNYVGLLTYAIYGLIERDFAALDTRMKDVIARENAVPSMLAQAKKNLADMPPVFIDIALENLDGGISFLGKDAPEAFKNVSDPALQKQLADSTEAAVNASKDFKAWLTAQKPKAHGSFVLGHANLQRLLKSDLVDVPVEKVLAAGEAQFAKDHAAYLEAEKLIDPKNPSKALSEVEADHPDAAHLISTARDGLVTLQSFIAQHRIVDLPSQQLPVVAETPEFARAVIFGQADPPGPLETHATKVYYYITPPDPKSSPDKQASMLAYWNRPMLQNLTVHEALPGHFTQWLFQHANPGWPLVRKLTGSYTTTEGWAHYSEQMMLEQGLSKGDPRYHLTQLQDALLRDCRLIASIKMHTGVMTLQQATDMMQKQCFQPSSVAPGEAKRGANDPGYYSYTLGKLEILKLRADAQKKLGKAFNLTKFHDAFMNAGLVPVSIIRREMGVEGSAL